MLERKHLAIVALLGSALACGDSHDHDDDHDESAEVGDATGATCPQGSTLSYDNFGKEFFASYCLSCHSSALSGAAARSGAPNDHNFDTLQGIQANIDHIDELTAAGPNATNTAMPPGGGPTLEERTKLGEWLACGAD
jgi:cytochrome c5